MIGRIIINPIYVARDSKGLYQESKWFTLFQAFLNFVLSIILVKKYNIFGVLIATLISQLIVLIPCNADQYLVANCIKNINTHTDPTMNLEKRKCFLKI